jgi:hypothetical protein
VRAQKRPARNPQRSPRLPNAQPRRPTSQPLSYYHSFISLTSGHVGPFILAVRVLSPAGARSFSGFINLFLKFPYTHYWTP